MPLLPQARALHRRVPQEKGGRGTQGCLLDQPPPLHAAAPADGAAQWTDACVVDSPPPRGRPPGAAAPLPPLRPSPGAGQPPRPACGDLFLAGPWTGVPCDPLLWGYASTPLTHFTVKQATLRLIRLRALHKLASLYSPSQAVFPALWGSGASGAVDPGAVHALADKQRAKFLALAAAAEAAAAREGRRRRPQPTDAELGAMYDQPWMHPSPARVLPAVRAAQRQLGQAGQRQPAAEEDTADPLTQTGAGRPGWRAAWGQVHTSDRRRHHRAFAWALLHGALPCGAAKVSNWPTGADGLAEVACCGNAACRPTPTADAATQAGALETLLHALLDCPAVRPALRWAADLWGRIEGGGGPPITPQVWLQGEDSAWQPQRETNRPLWHALRFALLLSVWSLRCRRVTPGGPSSPRPTWWGRVSFFLTS